ncbi:MAG TPA: FGGY family carbohydrate kinase [Ktedonosporobacter sp.]|nr:FGGY family carbohydrate kinase [Ktedonosporobacter sp.]
MVSGPYFMGIDGGTEGVRVGIFDREGTPMGFASQTYTLKHPRPGWAEQDPDEWWSSLVAAVRAVISKSGIAPNEIAGLSLDATTCTVVALDKYDRLLRPAIIWMDVRATDQARRVAKTGDPALKYNGFAKVSAEWMPCKALWLKEHEPDIYHAATHICEYIDWMTYRLTGEWTASINIASIRWYYDRNTGGFPASLYQAVELDDLLEKFPQKVLDMGTVVGGLAKQAAAELGLPPGIPVAEGGADSMVATVGMNVLAPGEIALITGSSHAIFGESAEPIYGPGFFGAFTDAVVPGQYVVEGGQVSTGSVVKWFRDNFCGGLIEEAQAQGIGLYDLLNQRAENLPVGSDGLVVVDHWQGNRTPYADSEARGMIWGLTLKHDAAYIYRAILEGICYGTELIFRTLRSYGFQPRQIVACGGPLKSPFWMQIHADVSNLPITFTKVSEAAVLGSAILAAVGAGIYPNLQEAARSMVHTSHRIEPDQQRHQEYQFYVDKYIATYPQMQELMHDVVQHVAERK